MSTPTRFMHGVIGTRFAKSMPQGVTRWGTQAVIAIVLSLALPLLGMGGVASAQSSAVNVQGTIDSVDCQAQTMVVDTPNGQQTFATSDNAFTNVDSANLPFCSLEGYVGAPATVWLAPDNNQLVVTEVSVTGPVATPQPDTAGVSPLPIWGAVLGTVVVAGLLYLVTRGPDGLYYRYPYYGGYYQHYYNSGYRPYTGYYSASAAIITVAAVMAGVVLGTVIVNGDPYIVSRNSSGSISRYPYWGPYRQYYYRPSYQPYVGVSVNVYRQATVYQGNTQWDAPAHAMAQVYGTPAVRNFSQQQPAAGSHQLTGTPSPRQPQAGTQRPAGTAPQLPQPTTKQPTTTAPHQPQATPQRPTGTAPQQPARQAPQQSQPTQQQPARLGPEQSQPTQQQPAKQTPQQSQPTQQQPARQAPQQSQPAKPQPAKQAPQQSQPTQQQPARQAPQQSQPTQQQPAKQAPQQSRPTQQQPARQAPQQSQPTQQQPAKQAPQQSQPTQQQPAKQAPQQSQPTQQQPARQAPQQSQPAKPQPAKQAPQQSQPAKPQPAKQAPQQKCTPSSQASQDPSCANQGK